MSAAIFAAYGSHNYTSRGFHKSLPSPHPEQENAAVHHKAVSGQRIPNKPGPLQRSQVSLL